MLWFRIEEYHTEVPIAATIVIAPLLLLPAYFTRNELLHTTMVVALWYKPP